MARSLVISDANNMRIGCGVIGLLAEEMEEEMQEEMEEEMQGEMLPNPNIER